MQFCKPLIILDQSFCETLEYKICEALENIGDQNVRGFNVASRVSLHSLVRCVDPAHTQIIATTVTIISEHISITKSSKYAGTYFFCTGALYK
jgi:hypothetical protein